MISLILLKLFTFSQILQGVPKLSHATVYRYIFYVCKAKIYTEFRAPFHRIRDGRKRILFAFIILQKCGIVKVEWVFTDSKGVLLLSVWPKIREYFKSKWAHRRLHLSCSEHATVPHSTQTLEQRTFL